MGSLWEHDAPDLHHPFQSDGATDGRVRPGRVIALTAGGHK